MFQCIPIRPTVADNRTSKLLILLVPVVDFPSVTAEVASSSLVVPAILFTELREKFGSRSQFPTRDPF